MFKVKARYDNKTFMVYSIHRTEMGETWFLCFENGHWYWWDAQQFVPEEEK